MVTCWCALDEATIANGCLWMIPGSHLDGVTDRETWQRYEPVDGVEPPEARPIELAAGSCSFHHGLILHASRPNLTDRPRWGYATHYASARCRFGGEAGDHVTIRGRRFPGCV
jgi:ectoine hydroxylase-related dioxygenase (phytanoyl-CoA dioxygenase family)